MSRQPRQITADTAGRLAAIHGWDQIVIVCRSEGEDGGEMVTHAGRGPRDAKIAEELAGAISEHALGWVSDTAPELDQMVRDAKKEMATGPDSDPNLGQRLIKLPGE